MIFIAGTKKLGLPKCYRWLEFIDTINIIKFHLLTERYFLQPWPSADVSIFVFFSAFLWFTYAVTALFEFYTVLRNINIALHLTAWSEASFLRSPSKFSSPSEVDLSFEFIKIMNHEKDASILRFCYSKCK